MKINLKKDELLTLIQQLGNCREVTFNTKLEARMCGAVLKRLVRALIKKSIDLKPSRKIELDDTEMLALNFVLPQIKPEHDLDQVIIWLIHTQINQACLSI